MDISEHIQYWVKGSEEDIAAAESLVEKGYFRHGLYFAHLAIEKMLKAHVVKVTQKAPPKIHHLRRLADIAKIALEPEQQQYLLDLGVYQLEGRYPDAGQLDLSRNEVRRELLRMKETVIWLKQRLLVR